MIHIGEIYNSNNCGKFKVLKELMVISGPGKPKDKYYLIEFLDTGYITDASKTAIIGGRVKDKYINI